MTRVNILILQLAVTIVYSDQADKLWINIIQSQILRQKKDAPKVEKVFNILVKKKRKFFVRSLGQNNKSFKQRIYGFWWSFQNE